MASTPARSLFTIALLLSLAPALAGASGPPPDPGDRLLFPDATRRIEVVRAVEHEGEVPAGRVLPPEDPLATAILGELADPFYRSLIRLSQAARNLAGDAAGPNVLYLSQEEGGFARRGLVLIGERGEEAFPELSYVDLVVDAERLEGGELDIFSHELGHAMMNVLWPTLGEGAEAHLSPKMHLSMGITDPYTALFEGFGISFQRLTHERIRRYRELFEARLRRADNATTWWHSTVDGELRLAAVLQNRYVFERLLPRGIDREGLSPEERVLLAHATPIFDPTRLRNARQMLASEGVLATLFYRMASSEELAGAYQEVSFYRPFLLAPPPPDTRAEDLFTPFENVMLKHFWVWHRLDATEDDGGRSDLFRYLEEWIGAFPEDREALVRLFVGTTVGRTVTPAVGQRFLEMTRRGLLGDYAGYAAARAAYGRLLDETVARVLHGELALDGNVGPELWIPVPGVTIRHALWSPEPRQPLRIDLNTAYEEELALLPGVDREEAAKIVTRREEKGFFHSLDEVRALGVELPAPAD